MRKRLLGILAFVVDGLFFVLWLLVNFGVERVKEFVDPQDVDLVLFRVFQVVFGFASLFPVVWDLWEDIRSKVSRGDDNGSG